MEHLGIYLEKFRTWPFFAKQLKIAWCWATCFLKPNKNPPVLEGPSPKRMSGFSRISWNPRGKCTFHMQVKELFIQWNPRADRLKKWSGGMGPYKWPYIWVLLLMEEIRHHLGCLKPYKQWDIYHINWCRISSINRSTVTGVITPINGVVTLLIFIRGPPSSHSNLSRPSLWNVHSTP